MFSKKTKIIILGSIFTIVTSFFFQNCSKASFRTMGSDLLGTGSTSASTGTTGTNTNGTNNGGGLYSENCADFAAKGWSSIDQCLKDGSWHVVFQNLPVAGLTSLGSADDLKNHMLAGADIKVIFPTQNVFANGVQLPTVISGNEECQQVYQSQNGAKSIYCLTTARFSGEANAQVQHGSTRYGSDGSMYCNGFAHRGQNECGGLDAVAYKWYVRY